MGILIMQPGRLRPGPGILLNLLLYLPLLATAPMPGQALAAPPDEYAVKSVYLYQFPKFVIWPSYAFTHTAAPLVLCLLGEDPFGPSLREFEGRSVQERPLEVRHFPRVALIQGCNMLYISASERSRLSRILADLEGLPVLTVSDMDGFAVAGGMIALVRRGPRVSLEINLDAVHRSGLDISSKLLRLAEIIPSEHYP